MNEDEQKLKEYYKKLGIHPPSKDVYPISHTFNINTVNIIGNQKSYTMDQIRGIFAETLGEYEHGSADIEDLIPHNPINVEQLSIVLEDALLCLEHWVLGEDDEP